MIFTTLSLYINMDFLNEYHLSGLVIGICTFLIIGIFHPIVVKAEYYWGTKCWWIFLLLGIGGAIASLCTDNILGSLAARRIRLLLILDHQRSI